MRRASKFFQLLFIAIAFYACKSQKQLTSQSINQQKADSIALAEKFGEIDSSTFMVDKELEVKVDSAAIKDSLESLAKLFEKDTLLIIGVGDIMMGTNFPKVDYLPPNKGRNLLDGVRNELKSADLTFGNHEGVILNDGGEQKECRNPDVCYLFRSPEYIAQNLVDAGFDVVSLANNHAGDFGDTGRVNTMRVLDSLGIHYGGLLMKPYASFEIDGTTYGFAAFSPNSGTQSIIEIKAAKEIISHLDSLNDIVIVSFHGGAEGKDHQHVTKETETYYGENRGNVYRFSHELIDAGADIIFGHGPHVTRAVEVYKKRFIAYSLGNFCTYARFNLKGPNGVAPIVKVYTNQNGEFLKGTIIPVKQIGSGIPVVDEEKVVIRYVRELTEADFPESEIIIDDEGNINYIQSEI